MKGNGHHHTRSQIIPINRCVRSFKYANPALKPEQTFLVSTMDDAVQKANRQFKSHRRNLDIDKLVSASSVLAILPPKAEQTHVVYTKIQKLAKTHNVPYGFFNHTSWKPQMDPPLPLAALPRQKWDENQFVLSTGPKPEWVDVVVNNLDEGSHPFHLV